MSFRVALFDLDGTALDTFAKMVAAQGGDPLWIKETERFPKAKYQRAVLAPADGNIVRVDAEGYGSAALLLGAGRSKKEDNIDHTAGIVLSAKTGDTVRKGDVIATLYSSNESLFDAAEKKLLESTCIGEEVPQPRPLILAKVE